MYFVFIQIIQMATKNKVNFLKVEIIRQLKK